MVKKSLVIKIIIELYMRSEGASQKQLVDALKYASCYSIRADRYSY